MAYRMKKKSISYLSLKVVAIMYTLIAVILLLFPYFWLLSSALKDNIEIYKTPPAVFPPMTMRREIDIDYSRIKDESDLTETIKKDAVMAIWGSNYEFRNENVQKIKVNSYKDGILLATIEIPVYKLRIASKEVLNAKINYISSNVKKRYGELFEYTRFEMFTEKKVSEIIQGDIQLTRDIEEYLYKNYDIKGDITNTKKYSAPFLYVNNFISAWINAGEQDSSVNILGFGRFLKNSVFVSFTCILIQLIISSTAGYSLSKLVKGKLGKAVLIFFLATMMIPFISTLVPMYIIVDQMGIMDTLWAVILPTTSSGFAIIIFKGFFDNIPTDLIEAARIDGASELYTYSRIVVPLSKPVFGVISLSAFLSTWGDFMWPNIVLANSRLWTFTVALFKMQTGTSLFPNEGMALNVIAILPTLIFMLIFQKSIQKGFVFAGIKG